MAQDPDAPLDSGRVRLPRTDAAMNRIAPTAGRGGKGSRRDKKPVALRTEAQKEREDDQTILARARKRFDRCVEAESDNRRAAIDDLKHKSGEGQWPADVVAERNFDNKPCLTINKIPTFVNQIVNDERQNRPAINVNPVGDRADLEVAKMYRGLIRAIERDSNAEIAYDTAFESAVDVGFGYWRIMTEFEREDAFTQVITIRRVRNRFSVYLDPSCQERDGSDARYGFVTEMIPRSEFEDDFPDADPIPWSQSGPGDGFKNWISEHEIRIAEYFELEYEKARLVQLVTGHVGWWEDLDEEAKKQEIVDERQADRPSITWYKITAKEILKRQKWPGRYIPIVRVVGNEIDIEGKLKLSGLIRAMKSPQQMYNFFRTAGIELVSMQPKAPWVGAEGQFEGHEDDWDSAHKRNIPRLEYKVETLDGKPLPPPRREPFAGVPAGIVQETQAAAQDMMAVTGIRWDATLKERMYDESGRALRELRRQGDVGSFHYVDNLAQSLRRTGEILVDLIPKIYDTRRMLTILREDDQEEMVLLDPDAARAYSESRNPRTNKPLKIFNPTIGRYGVTVTIGPSYATKRIEAAESMMDFVRALPQTGALIADLVAKNQDWPGAEEMARRLAMTLPPHLIAPAMKDVPPQVQAMLQGMRGELQKLTVERQQLIAALGNQNADRAVKQDQVDKRFEIELLKIVQKADAQYQKEVGGNLAELAEVTRMLIERLGGAPPGESTALPAPPTDQPPPESGGFVLPQ